MDAASSNTASNGAAADGTASTVANPPGQDTIAYRVGDFASFRRALLQPLPGERELAGFAPLPGDLGLQALEWWAYLADILAFYNERIATESYLRTASRPESVDRLVRVLGYRPRPGIAATGQLAALRRPARAGEPLVVPAGTPITSTPSPGVPAQTFETTTDATFTGPDAVPVTLIDTNPLMTAGSVLLAGRVTGVRPGDRLLLVQKEWHGISDDWALVTVSAVTTEPDPSGRPNSRISYASVDAGSDPGAAKTSPLLYRLLRPTASAPLWTHGDATGQGEDGAKYTVGVIDYGDGYIVVRLASVNRGAAPGDLVLLDGTSQSVPGVVASNTEELWFVGSDGASYATFPTPPGTTAPVLPVMNSALKLTAPVYLDTLSLDPASTVLRSGLRDVGTVIADPVRSTLNLRWPITVEPQGTIPPGASNAFVEDATGIGLLVSLAPGNGSALLLSLPPGAAQPPVLTAPLRLLFDLVPVSRGKSVPAETLGGGDARITGQTFTLAKLPLTYLAAGPGYASTLRVLVNGIAWSEVDSFHGQAADARVYTTRTLPDGTTQVRFGDGVNGARLPTGTGNVVASYRYGSGAALPPVGRLTTPARPQPNLAGFRNPIAVAGGADPETPDSLRSGAPASTFTFGRAISATDYETIAAHTAGVRRATAVWRWDADEQRTLVTVYVGDDDTAAGLARAALAGAQDPSRPVGVLNATAIDLTLGCTLVISPDRRPDDVAAAALSVLLDPHTGLFSPARMPIGQTLFRSAIDAALNVDGVTAVRGLTVRAPQDLIADPPPPPIGARQRLGDGRTTLDERLVPVTGGYFQLTADQAVITTLTGSGPGDSHG